MEIKLGNTLLNFTPPQIDFWVGGLNFNHCLTSLSISRPLAELSTPYSWSGSATLSKPLIPSLLPESLDDLINPGRWARGSHPVKLYIKNILLCTLRILEYYFDEDTEIGTLELGDILLLLNDESPAEDYKGMNFTPCKPVSLQQIINTALNSAGIHSLSISSPGSIPVPPNKPSGSWIGWAQQYLGERGRFLFVDKNEVIRDIPYPQSHGNVLFRKSRLEIENYTRERSPDIPADKYIVSGSSEEFVCDRDDDGEDVEETWGLIESRTGRQIRALERREKWKILQKADLSPGRQSEGMPVDLKCHYQTVQIRQGRIEQALGVLFPEKYPGSTAIKLSEIIFEYKAFDSQGRLRGTYTRSNKLLGVVLPDYFPDNTTMKFAESKLEEFLENIPGTIPAANDGVLRRKETTFRSLFVVGPGQTKQIGNVIILGNLNTVLAVKEQTIEQWKEHGKCPCSSYKYTRRVSRREQEASPDDGQSDGTHNYSPSYYRLGGLSLQSNLSKDEEDSTPPDWERMPAICPTCTISFKGESTFTIASVSPYRKRNTYISSQTISSQIEAQAYARIVGLIAHQRYRSRSINLPIPLEYLLNPNPFSVVHIHKGAFVLDNPSIILAEDGLELAFKGNYIGAIPEIPSPPPISVLIEEIEYTQLKITKIPNKTVAVNSYFSLELSATGGVPPYSYTAILPEELELSGSIITGWIETSGLLNISVSVRDSLNVINTTTFTLFCQQPNIPLPPVQIIIGIEISHQHQIIISNPDTFSPEKVNIEIAHPHKITCTPGKIWIEISHSNTIEIVHPVGE